MYKDMYRCRTSKLKEIKISSCCALLVSCLHKVGVDSDVIIILIAILVFVVHQNIVSFLFCVVLLLLALSDASYPSLQMYQHGSIGVISVAFSLSD